MCGEMWQTRASYKRFKNLQLAKNVKKLFYERFSVGAPKDAFENISESENVLIIRRKYFSKACPISSS